MGDRGNIVVLDSGRPDDGAVFLYTHWAGSDIGAFATAAIRAAPDRWDDPIYFARVVAREMGMGQDGTTGFGISATLGDNNYPLVVLDCGQQKTFVVPESQHKRLHGYCLDNAGEGIPFSISAAKGGK